ncbi:hypothetical protein EYZ11_010511 [Aspergillus tanneri]|uniref:Gfo/Idh/MocA-like oxidoreductase N-terminal domain-containing protein n=1 Tax=Aspergillus tanneri TaxID=1220188 RepID=A0A4V3UN71_9EURO|nr:hypothetical protein EYZ11_010511 [Aspergillus tanneri]
MSVGVAIIGSGFNYRQPGIQDAKGLELKAIYSRSLKSAQNLASGVAGVDLYSDDSSPGKSYSDLLTRQDIAAVIIALPILVQPAFIRQAIAAGKHVLSEKPIAKDMATAQDLLSWYEANVGRTKTLWAVAENFRYMGKFVRAAEEVRKLGGIKNFRVNVRNLVKTDSKYYKTEWRQTPAYQGGFVLDGGIHIVAGLRLILGSKDPLATLSAQSCLQQQHLAPVDTVDAVVRTQSGATGVVSLSYGSVFNESTFEFTCAEGVVMLNGDRIMVNGDGYEIPFEGRGVSREIEEFGRCIVEDTGIAQSLRPEEALADLERATSAESAQPQRRFLRLNSNRHDNSERQPRTYDTDKMVLAKKHVPIVKKRMFPANPAQSSLVQCSPIRVSSASKSEGMNYGGIRGEIVGE